jgi:hypothetical protein
MTKKIGGEVPGKPSHKRYWLMYFGDNETVLESFDDLKQAIIYAGGIRKDRRYVIRDRGRTIVWPLSTIDD